MKRSHRIDFSYLCVDWFHGSMVNVSSGLGLVRGTCSVIERILEYRSLFGVIDAFFFKLLKSPRAIATVLTIIYFLKCFPQFLWFFTM